MAKDSIVNFRIDKDLKENAQELVKKVGFKNLSSFLRDYIEELSNFYNKDISELELLEEFYKNQLNDSDPGQKFFIKRKLTMIEEFKNVLEKEL